jgi:hypothetical protein
MNLGYCYLRGHGVAADRVEALRFFRLAVEQGEDKAEKEVERLENPAGRPKVRFVYTSEPGRHFGLVGTAGVEPPEDEIPEEERIRRELLEVLKSGEADAAVPSEVAVEATDDELFPIYAECGMQPDDFVDTTARKYAAYLRTLEQETEERKGGDRSTQ